MAASQSPITDRDKLAVMRCNNNPEGKPIGPYTGRCTYCASTDIWDDNLAWGCNTCGNICGTN